MIDFSTLQGLTIPEGVVTQITDASGRVLWSSAPPFDGIIYLRPSADISVDSTVTFTPSDATAAYLLISEEETDSGATTVNMSATQTTVDTNGQISGNARFQMNGNVPKKINKVNSIGVFVSATTSANTIDDNDFPEPTGYIGVIFYIDGAKKYLSFSGSAVEHGFENSDYTPISARMSGYKDLATLLPTINEYVSANGALPSMELEFEMSAYRYGTADKYSYGYVKVSQAYIFLECE